MIFPGFMTASGAAEINAALDRLRKLEEAVAQRGRIDLDQLDRPWMKLTGRYSGTGEYAWTEADFTSAGAFYDKVGGRSGTVNGLSGATVTYMPAVEMNGEVITSFPHYVRAEFAVLGSTGRRYYFKSNAPGTGTAAYKSGLLGLYSPTVYPGYTVDYDQASTYASGNLTTDATGIHLITGQLAAAATNVSYPEMFFSVTAIIIVNTGTAVSKPFGASYHPCGFSGQYSGLLPFCHVWDVTVAPCAWTIRFSNPTGITAAPYIANGSGGKIYAAVTRP